jgi:hypothetical protein
MSVELDIDTVVVCGDDDAMIEITTCDNNGVLGDIHGGVVTIAVQDTLVVIVKAGAMNITVLRSDLAFAFGEMGYPDIPQPNG